MFFSIRTTDFNKTRKRGIRFGIALALVCSFLLSSCSSVLPAVSPAVQEQNAGTSLDTVENPLREMRAIWIASVDNINYPSSPALDEKTLRAEIDDIIKQCEEVGFNTVFFQVRPSGDALYNSNIFPASEYLSGERGKNADGDFDALEYLISASQPKNIRVHAWVNPLRVTVGSPASPKTDVNALSENDPARKNPEYCISYADGRLYYDAGNPAVRTLIAEGCKEIAENYAVDGIVFDDYFYPYPVYEETVQGKVLAEFDDSASFALYGEGKSLEDWRRDNITALMRECYDAINSVSECELGVAPFGIWQNDNGENGGSSTAGLESYSSIYCDTLSLIREGCVDYIAPQLYWDFTTSVARFDTLARWWNAQLTGYDVKLYFSLGAYRYDEKTEPELEILRQIEFSRALLNYKGCTVYGYESVKTNANGVRAELVGAFDRQLHFDTVTNANQKLVFASPAPNSTVNTAKTYILGSANVSSRVEFNGQPLSLTKSGAFFTQVELEYGENRFNFVCDGKNYEYVIYREDIKTEQPPEDEFGAISVSPAERAVIRSGDTLPLSCVAPAGSNVYASISGKTVALSPDTKADAPAGYVAYKGKISLDIGGEAESESAGKILFFAQRNDESRQVRGGEVTVIAADLAIPVTVIKDHARLMSEPDGTVYTDLTPQTVGASDYAVCMCDGLYMLAMGGYISSENVRAGELERISEPSQIRQMIQTEGGGDTLFYVKCDRKPVVTADLAGDQLVFTVYNATVLDKQFTRDVNSSIVRNAELYENTDTGNAEIRITLQDTKNFYGYKISYEVMSGVQLVKITLNNDVVIKNAKRPLADKVIVLDAGHGGESRGALGAHGNGKNEADLNLAIALRLRERLEALGATVYLTRDSDVDMTLAERTEFARSVKPDLFISIHQNSMPYDADISSVSGVSAYYYAEGGELLAESLTDTVSLSLGRKNLGVFKEEFFVCTNHRFPCVLLELGFMTGVEEYDALLFAGGIERAAEAIKDGIVEFYVRAEKY